MSFHVIGAFCSCSRRLLTTPSLIFHSESAPLWRNGCGSEHTASMTLQMGPEAHMSVHSASASLCDILIAPTIMPCGNVLSSDSSGVDASRWCLQYD